MRKRRSLNQIKEDISYRILQQKIPETWVMHEYGPDYGIDCVIELFDYVDSQKSMAETLGETFYVQLKASSVVEYGQRRSYARGNVALGTLREDKSDFVDIDVARFQLDTSDLLTIQAMGTAIAVLLILVDVNTERAFFVCLNDYIDKILIPEDTAFGDKSTKIINIPVQNEIDRTDEKLVPLRLYGKRSKMFAAFNLFHYQHMEIRRRLGLTRVTYEMPPDLEIDMLKTFVRQALRQDIWEKHEFWAPIKQLHAELVRFGEALDEGVPLEEHKHCLEYAAGYLWSNLANLGNMYEDLSREWYLPTVLGQLTSYSQGSPG